MTCVVTGQVGGCQRAGVPRDGPRLCVGTRPGQQERQPSNLSAQRVAHKGKGGGRGGRGCDHGAVTTGAREARMGAYRHVKRRAWQNEWKGMCVSYMAKKTELGKYIRQFK